MTETIKIEELNTFLPLASLEGLTIHAHQLKDGYKTKYCSFELKSPQMEGFIKNKHAK
ncbi:MULTISPECIES: hypothetical protein [Bacillaceae]|uniref:hypothetical protein n=1 Tax=Bacillaceae TaxID=186817 RepID=UPI00031E486C|nr:MULTISPECIES: hypothetical protein [Bacillaceae]AJH03450.1 hypothetical protein AS86_6818 [Bacillus thuringiensis HD1002]MCC4014544.1 hypothetical protein [Bacillus thuringiensis]MCC4033421.1 hypothetical protein [Bacillus thuringiensis]MCR6820244.1 hypothetical protein [Bacillus thuringiensis]MEC2804526.1 hypothetical protein [Bacillus thuringiensis]